MNPTARKRVVLATVAIVLTGVALDTRAHPVRYPTIIANYAGDTLWAMCLMLMARVVWPAGNLAVCVFKMAVFCLLIELSQLYQAVWLDRIRHTLPGSLLLGFQFAWSDLVCYAMGLGLAVVVDLAAAAAGGRSRNR